MVEYNLPATHNDDGPSLVDRGMGKRRGVAGIVLCYTRAASVNKAVERKLLGKRTDFGIVLHGCKCLYDPTRV